MSGECEKCSEHVLDCKCYLEDDWFNLPYEQRLNIAKFMFEAITKAPGSSFRRLIYDRLGFKGDAYEPLYLAGGMMITNAMSNPDNIHISCL